MGIWYKIVSKGYITRPNTDSIRSLWGYRELWPDRPIPLR